MFVIPDDHPIQIWAEDGYQLDVRNQAGDSLYYSPSADISFSEYEDILTTGQTVRLTRPRYFLSAGRTTVYLKELGEASTAVLPTVIDNKGELLVGAADNSVDNLAPGSNGQVLITNTAAPFGVEWSDAAGVDPDKTNIVERGIAIKDPVNETYPGFFVQVATGETKTLVGVRHKTDVGSLTANIRRNGIGIAGLGSVSVTGTATTTSVSQALSNDDVIDIVISGVTSAPDHLMLTLFIQHTQ